MTTPRTSRARPRAVTRGASYRTGVFSSASRTRSSRSARRAGLRGEISLCASTGAATAFTSSGARKLAAVRERERLGDAKQGNPRAGARAEVEARVAARLPSGRRRRSG